MERYLPLGLGGLSSLAASMVDINVGAVAAGITLVATAVGAAYLQINQKRIAVRQADADSKRQIEAADAAAELKAREADAAAKLEILRQESAAKLEIMRRESAAMIEIQKQRDDANRESLSAQLEQISSQLSLVQGRMEDANRKLHQVNNDQQARELRHAAEKMELEQKYADIVGRLDSAHSENVALLARLGDNAAATTAQADRNSARLDALEGP